MLTFRAEVQTAQRWEWWGQLIVVGTGRAGHVTQCRTGMHDIEPYHRGHVTKLLWRQAKRESGYIYMYLYNLDSWFSKITTVDEQVWVGVSLEDREHSVAGTASHLCGGGGATKYIFQFLNWTFLTQVMD